jgi:hypothetical protein
MRELSLWQGWKTAALVISCSSLAWLGDPAWAQLSDISTYWGAQYIAGLNERQIIGGFPDGTFRPNESITRAQFAVIVTKAFGLDTNVPVRSFADPIPSWAAPSIGAAAAAGFVSGFPDGTFRPNDVLTRAQAITVLTRAATNGRLIEDAGQIDAILSAFGDANLVPNFARAPIATAVQEGLLVLYPNPTQLNAQAVATRGEVAALTYQALAKVGRVPNLDPPVGAAIPGPGIRTELLAQVTPTPEPLATPDIPIEPLVETLPAAPEVRTFFAREELGSVNPGDTVTVFLLGSPGAQGSFSIPGIAYNLPLQETRPGQYEGSYTFRSQDRASEAPVFARLERDGLVTLVQLPDKTITIGRVTDTTFPHCLQLGLMEQICQRVGPQTGCQTAAIGRTGLADGLTDVAQGGLMVGLCQGQEFGIGRDPFGGEELCAFADDLPAAALALQLQGYLGEVAAPIAGLNYQSLGSPQTGDGLVGMAGEDDVNAVQFGQGQQFVFPCQAFVAAPAGAIWVVPMLRGAQGGQLVGAAVQDQDQNIHLRSQQR